MGFKFVDLFAELVTQGFSRARVDGATIQLTEPPKLKKQEKQVILFLNSLVVKVILQKMHLA